MSAAVGGAAPAVSTLEPSAEQREILGSAERTIVVAANAGAAKTTTLALRIGEALRRGVAPNRLVALTFTRPAADALASALQKVGAPALPAGAIQSFDQFAAGVLLGIEGRPVPSKSTPEALAPVVGQAIRALDLGADDGFVERYLQVARRLKGTLARDRLRWDGVRLNDASADELGVELPLLRLFDAVEAIRYPPVDGCDRPRFRAEFDAAYDLARLLRDPESPTSPTTLPTWPRTLEHLLVDEMHDLNETAFTILKALLQNPATRFCGVGDVDQVVHQTDGAERRFMEPGADLGAGRTIAWLPLTASRRFGPKLARAAGALAGKPYAGDPAAATEVVCIGTPGDGPDVAARVVDALRRKVAMPGRQKPGLAVLLRHPSQSVAIENALLAAEIPYRVRGFESYLLQDEVLLVRALLALALHDTASITSEATRRRLVRAVVFFCGVELDFGTAESETPEARLDEAVRHVARDAGALEPFLVHQVLERADPAIAVRMRDAIRIVEAADAGGGSHGSGLLEALLDALRIDRIVPTVFVEKQRRADALAYLAGLVDAARTFDGPRAFFASLNLAETRFEAGAGPIRGPRQAAARLRRSAVTLATIPEAKGHEFDHVIVPYLSAGSFPAPLGGTLLEERNLFYVAITRARRALTLIVDERRPSRFVAEAGLKGPGTVAVASKGG